MTMLRAGGLLDVLTSLSDCGQEPVEKMERRISGGSYMHWIDFYNEIFCCGFLCALLISVSSSGSLFGYHAEGYHAPPSLFSGYHAQPIPYGYHAEGYHARTDAFKLTGYRVCRVTAPELPRCIQLLRTGGLSHLRVVFCYFSFIG